MQEVTLKRDELLESLSDNRKGHRQAFLDAQEGWKAIILNELETRLADARAGRRYSAAFHFPEPEDHTKDYDRVIRMVEMSVDDHLTISEHDFAQFVMDDWEWKANWTASNSRYSK